MNRDRSKKAELMERNSALIGKKFRETYLPASFCSLSRIAVIAIDSIVAGSSIGATALAAVALFSPISSMDEVIYDLCCSGMTNNIAKLRGEHEQDKANQFFTFTLLRMICIYLVFCTLLIVFARPVFSFFSKEESLVDMALDYFYPMVAAMPLMSVMTGVRMVFRIDGRPKFFSFISLLQSIGNVLLDILFVNYFSMGIKGLAYATIISACISYIVMLTHVFMGKCSLKFDFRILKDIKTCIQYRNRVVKSGQTYAVGDILHVFTGMMMNKLIGEVGGSAGLAVYGIFNACDNICGCFALAISNSTALLGGILFGEGDFEGLRIVLRRACATVAKITLGITIFIELFTGFILSLYGIDNQSVMLAYWALRIGCLSFPVYGLNRVYVQYLVAVDNHKYATLILFIETGMKFPVAWLITRVLGIHGVWIGIVLTEVIAFIPILINKLRKNWYFLPDTDDSQLRAFSFILSEENIVKASQFADRAIRDVKFQNVLANRVALLIEESGMYILHENAGNHQPINCEIRIRFADDKLYVVICDDGKLFNPICEVRNNEFMGTKNLEKLMLNAFSRKVTYDRIVELNFLVLCCKEVL